VTTKNYVTETTVRHDRQPSDSIGRTNGRPKSEA